MGNQYSIGCYIVRNQSKQAIEYIRTQKNVSNRYLRMAIEAGMEDVVLEMIDKKTNTYESEYNGEYLWLACQKNMEKVALIYSQLLPKSRNRYTTRSTYDHAFIYACKNNMEEVALNILTKGVLER